jgi:hypothetical protein
LVVGAFSVRYRTESVNSLYDNDELTRYPMKFKQLKAPGDKEYFALFKMNVDLKKLRIEYMFQPL